MAAGRLSETIRSDTMNPLGGLLGPDDVRLDLDVSNKDQLLEQIAILLGPQHRLPSALVLEYLKAREQLGSTAVGHGVAIPHARMPGCVAPAAAFVRTKLAIQFDAPDGKPVSVFIGLIVPNMAQKGHLQLLATAAGMLSDRVFREKLMTATERTTMKDLLTAWPDTRAT